MMLEKGHKGGKSKRWNRRWVETDWCSEAVGVKVGLPGVSCAFCRKFEAQRWRVCF